METQETLRQMVRQERERRALSVRSIVKDLGVSNTTWSNYENGATSLTLGMQHAVAVAFDWPINWPETRLAGYVAPSDVDEVAELKERVARLELALEALGERAAKTDARARKTAPRPRKHPTDPTGPA